MRKKWNCLFRFPFRLFLKSVTFFLVSTFHRPVPYFVGEGSLVSAILLWRVSCFSPVTSSLVCSSIDTVDNHWRSCNQIQCWYKKGPPTCPPPVAINGQVSPKPGQKDLSPGDVILWINGMFLIGFDEDSVTDRFAEAFANGAPLVVGKLSTLMKHELQDVEEAVKKLIWPHVLHRILSILLINADPFVPCWPRKIILDSRAVYSREWIQWKCLDVIGLIPGLLFFQGWAWRMVTVWSC